MSSPAKTNGKGTGSNAAADGVFGKPIKRKEDPRLLRGDGRYLADLKLHGMLSAAVIRSPHPHAKIISIDTSAADADPRVVAVLTHADLPDLPPLPCIDAEETTKPFNQPIIASEKVRYVGEPVAVIVAADRYLAEDVMHLVEVEYEPLPSVADAELAMGADAPIIHEETNVCDTLEYKLGDPDAAFAKAPHVLKERFSTQRYAGMPMECRGAIADWDPRNRVLTLTSSTQVPNSVKRDVCLYLDLPESGVRVLVPDVGGAFGVKIQTYPEEVLLAFLARRLERPVKWVEDRWEHLVSATHGREQFHDVEVAYDDDGRVLAIRDHCVTNTGAYLQRLTLVEPFIGVSMLTGPYDITDFEAKADVVMTNKTPMNTFRGVGHVQAAFTMERIIDMVAQDRGLDPAEVRRRNLIKADAFPLPRGLANVLAGEIIYDSGDYQTCLERVLEISGYEKFRNEQEAMRAEGRVVGIGIGCFVEETGLGPYEMGTVRIEASGRVIVLTGACTSGQGHLTTLAQIAADTLDVGMDEVEVRYGDTDIVRWGVGTYASRTAVVGGTAIRNASNSVRDKVLEVAAGLLEANAGDLELRDGKVIAKGSPGGPFVSLADVAAAVSPGQALPEGIDDYGLESTDVFHPETNTFAYGMHVSKVEVDPETGIVKLLDHHVVNDSGTVINPLILDGQVQGGVAFGVGGALLEEVVYDDDAQPRNPNFMDYLLPGDENLPDVVVEHMVTPTHLNPDGIKGGGEGGAVGAPAAIANAVADAIQPGAVTETPITPDRVFRAMAAASNAE
jgi:aerobic carbon-monoxide dehydrogenase large subunit